MDFMILALSLALTTQELKPALAEAGLLGTSGMPGAELSSVVAGWYSDNYGRRRVLLYCVTTFAVFIAAVSYCQKWCLST